MRDEDMRIVSALEEPKVAANLDLPPTADFLNLKQRKEQ
jgi:hypothetical protein